MSRYRLEIVQIEEIDSFENQRIYGKDAEKIAQIFGATLDKDYAEKEYMDMQVPCKKKIEEVIYKQTVDSLDLGTVITIINKKGG